MPDQVSDNLSLLQLMLEDQKTAAEVYQTTNYWAVSRDRLLRELEEFGLENFRRRRNSVLSSFGATDLPKRWFIDFVNMSPILSNRFINKVPFWFEFKMFLNHAVDKLLRISPFYLDYF